MPSYQNSLCTFPMFLTTNKVILLAKLEADPQIIETTSGNKMAKLRVSTIKKWFNAATKQMNSSKDYHTVRVVGDKNIEMISRQNPQPGAQIFIEGALSYYSVGEGEQRKTLSEVFVRNKSDGLLIISSGQEKEDDDPAW